MMLGKLKGTIPPSVTDVSVQVRTEKRSCHFFQIDFDCYRLYNMQNVHSVIAFKNGCRQNAIYLFSFFLIEDRGTLNQSDARLNREVFTTPIPFLINFGSLVVLLH